MWCFCIRSGIYKLFLMITSGAFSVVASDVLLYFHSLQLSMTATIDNTISTTIIMFLRSTSNRISVTFSVVSIFGFSVVAIKIGQQPRVPHANFSIAHCLIVQFIFVINFLALFPTTLSVLFNFCRLFLLTAFSL